MSNEAFFCLVTWPDGTEGLLFPRPGNVPINKTLEDGTKDFEIATKHLAEHVTKNPKFAGTKVRLVKFARLETVKEFPESAPEPSRESTIADMYACPSCRRQMTHTHRYGYICEYCTGIED